MLNDLKVKVGLQKRSYYLGSFDTLFNISCPNSVLTTLKIEHQEVYDALEY